MPRYKIESTHNGAFWTITRLEDGATLALQGDDAVTFARCLEATHAGYTEDDVCDEYSDVFRLPT